MAYKDNAKNWFQEGDYPTEGQFSQTFDWLRWRDQGVPIEDVIGLADALNDIVTTRVALPLTISTTTSITIPDGYMVERIIIIPSANCKPVISYEDGAPGDIIPEPEDFVTPATGAVYEVSQLIVTSRNIVVQNVPINSRIVYMRRKII